VTLLEIKLHPFSYTTSEEDLLTEALRIKEAVA
jgi:hypothetical protein